MSISENIQLVSEPINKLLTPLASSAGKTLQDMWELVFGNFGNYVEKKRIVRLQALEDFKTSLETKVAAIPEERLCEPTLSIVGPALESSKYYFEEPDIREMFAKLISSAMDCETAPSVHPALYQTEPQPVRLYHYTKEIPNCQLVRGQSADFSDKIFLLPNSMRKKET